MPRVHKVQSARKDYPESGIKKGDTYFHWSFRFGGKHKSKTYPRRSQLTQSSFLSELYSIEDNLSFDPEDLEGGVSDLVSQIEELKSQCEDSLSNMPDHLQESSDSGIMLQERIDALDSWISDLQSVDLDIDEELDEEARDARIQEIVDELGGMSAGL